MLHLQLASRSYRTFAALAGLPSLWLGPALPHSYRLLLLVHRLHHGG